MGRFHRPFGNLSVIILKKKMGLRPILIVQGFNIFIIIMNNHNNNAGFVNDVQRWVVLDTQLKLANEKLKQMRESKNQLTSQICNYVDTKNMRDTKLEISDGNLRVYDRKEYSPITFTYIEACLDKIIPNKEHVAHIIKHLKDNRDITIVSDIRRNTTK